MLLQALVHLPGVTAVIVGSGPEQEALERLASELGVHDRTLFAGWVPDGRNYLSVFDVFVLPSRFEALPLVAIEAMRAGVPCVISDVGSVREAVAHEVTGILVPAEDVEALAAAVRRLLDDPPLRSRLGAAGRDVALERFTVDRMAREFEALYREIAP